MKTNNPQDRAYLVFQMWRADWNKFISDVLGAELDEEQRAIVEAVQQHKLVSVSSGTARGKDYVAACIALAFLYLTPKWNKKKELIKNTKVALTAPTDRQIKNIMMPEISRLFNKAKRRGVDLPGKLNAYDIRTNNTEWFLTGFKADEHNHEAWTGFHAVNTMFIVTEASGISESIYEAIEGNLQGDSRLLLVFNPNTSVGYAARSQKSKRWKSIRLNSLTAPNVIAKKNIYQGQVDYEWVKDKVEAWCEVIRLEDFKESENDFEFEGNCYRPSDLFRKKVLGEFPKADEDVLIPAKWIEAAQDRYTNYEIKHRGNAILGLDVAGMGRDNSVFCLRHDNYVEEFKKYNSAGKADHMRVAGLTANFLKTNKGSVVSIDTIGEGAGVYSRVVEVLGRNKNRVISCKYSESAKNSSKKELTDLTGQYTFANMRAYLFWAVRDWLNPDNKTNAMLPPGGSFLEEATEIRWSFTSSGKIVIEPKEGIKHRLGYSIDEFDALANTFHPEAVKQSKKAKETKTISRRDIESMLY